MAPPVGNGCAFRVTAAPVRRARSPGHVCSLRRDLASAASWAASTASSSWQRAPLHGERARRDPSSSAHPRRAGRGPNLPGPLLDGFAFLHQRIKNPAALFLRLGEADRGRRRDFRLDERSNLFRVIDDRRPRRELPATLNNPFRITRSARWNTHQREPRHVLYENSPAALLVVFAAVGPWPRNSL